MEEKLESTLRKIAIVGPESTGKSFMAKRLARDFGTFYVPEYSRYYCEGLDNEYTLEDEMNIFYGQLALEDSLLDVVDQPLLFCDTTILTVKIWSDYLFQHTPEEVLSEIQTRSYDFYLLMDIDLPWEDDPIRDFPKKRGYFMNVWKKELKVLKTPYAIINGQGEDRYQNGIKAVKYFIEESS